MHWIEAPQVVVIEADLLQVVVIYSAVLCTVAWQAVLLRVFSITNSGCSGLYYVWYMNFPGTERVVIIYRLVGASIELIDELIVLLLYTCHMIRIFNYR